MSFLHPEFLYFTLPPLFILFVFLVTKKELHEHFFTRDVMDRLRVSANTLTLKVRNILFFIMTIFMVIALAQPVINDGVIEVKAKSADIMIAFDISDSMLATDVYPNRLELAKEKAIELLNIAPNERIGVIAFAKNSYLVSPMSFDHAAVNFLLRQLDTSSITEKGTNFLSMLEVVDKNIKNKKRYLLIISDGGDSESFSDEIAFAKAKNITVFVLGMGTKKGTPIKRKDGSFIKYKGDIIISKLNENIANLATETGGVYIQNVKSNEDVKTMLQEIEAKSKQKELKSEKIHRYIPLFYYPLGIALLLLLVATSTFPRKINIGVFIVLFLFINPHAKAGMLDFIELNKAKKAYDSGEYEKSAKLYESYAKKSNNTKGYYNAANAFYKQKKYKEALKTYKKANFKNKDLKAKNLANMGNAYAKEMKQEQLKKAVKSYEESLKLKEDKYVRENLEEVKKFLKKQQQKSQNKKNNKDNKKQNAKNNKQKDKQKNQSDKKENKNKDSKKDKNKKHKQDSDKKDEQKKKEQQKKQDLKKLNKDEKDDKKSKSINKQPMQMKDKMSNAEEAKWLKQLNLQKNTYLYKLNTKKHKEVNTDEKPW